MFEDPCRSSRALQAQERSYVAKLKQFPLLSYVSNLSPEKPHQL